MLELRGVAITFQAGGANEVRALAGIDLTVPQSQFVTIIGGNGSGKSTLLTAIAGSFLLDAGSIRLDGQDLTRLAEHRRARWIGRVFQDPTLGTAADLSIAENLALAAQKGEGGGLRWAIGRGLLKQLRERLKELGMGLEDRLWTPIGNLSGGQRQALSLLMATWHEPRLLLLDEHTAALDPKTANLILRLSEEIIQRGNLTTLMVTHSMQQAVNLGDRLLMLSGGRILHDFPPSEKRWLRPADLQELFEEVRRKEQLDPSAAELLAATYI